MKASEKEIEVSKEITKHVIVDPASFITSD